MRACNWNTVVNILILITIMGLVFHGFCNFMRAFEDGRLCECKDNLREISNALEMYANDNDKHYPSTLTLLVPIY